MKKPDINQINSFSERIFKLKNLKFLREHYNTVLATIENIYSYADHLEEENTRLSIAFNAEREKREKLQIHSALLQLELNKHIVKPTIPYLKDHNIRDYYVIDNSYHKEFKEAFNYKTVEG